MLELRLFGVRGASQTNLRPSGSGSTSLLKERKQDGPFVLRLPEYEVCVLFRSLVNLWRDPQFGTRTLGRVLAGGASLVLGTYLGFYKTEGRLGA